MEKTKTRWDIFIDDICLWDTIYECDYGRCIETKVTTQPTLIDWYWSWKAINVDTWKEIDYGYTAWNEHSAYWLKLYSYEAYKSVSRF